MTAVAADVVVSGHLLETSTLALPLWALLFWLIQRTVRTGNDRMWILIGAAAGASLMESDLVASMLGSLIIAFLVVGPRRPLTSPWFYAGVALAFAIWSPYLAWQAAHGWPQGQFKVATSIMQYDA